MLLNKNKVKYGSIIKKIRGSSLIPAKSTGTGTGPEPVPTQIAPEPVPEPCRTSVRVELQCVYRSPIPYPLNTVPCCFPWEARYWGGLQCLPYIDS